MDPLLSRIAAFAAHHGLFPPGARAGVAVSGGADSVFLLHALAALAPEWSLQLVVLHLDHALRSESAKDADFVRELAASLGLPAEVHREEVGRAGDNVEQAGREARRRFYAAVRARERLASVATGHTRSDQAETILQRLLRGAGPTGLAAILPATREGVVRPLLEVDRAEIETWLRERSLAWREDATNRDPRFVRNRIRHHLLPHLAAEYNPALLETLAGAAAIARDEEAYWAAEVARLAPAALRSEPGAVFVDTGAIGALPRAAARRLLREALRRVRGDLRRIEFGHLERLLGLALQPQGAGRLSLPNADVMRSFETIRITEPGADPRRPYERELPVPGRTELPGSGAIEAELDGFPAGTAVGSAYNGNEAVLDWDLLAGPLVVRNWEPGDRYRRAGGGGEQLVKALFQEARVPLWERKHWPVITAGRNIVWVQRFGPSEAFAAGPHTRTILRIREIPGAG